VRAELKGALVGASSAAATASAWAHLVVSTGVRLGDDETSSSCVAAIWLAAVLAGMPIAVVVGRRAGDIAGRAARYRALTLFAIAGVTAAAVSLVAASVLRGVYQSDILGPMLVRALSCALLGAIVLERWARPVEELPAARAQSAVSPSGRPASG
jgi:hypothetical protein